MVCSVAKDDFLDIFFPSGNGEKIEKIINKIIFLAKKFQM
jgi:hypothetical protein